MNENRRSGFLQSVVLVMLVLVAVWAYDDWQNGRSQLPDGNDPLPVLMTPQLPQVDATEYFPATDTPQVPEQSQNAAVVEAELAAVTVALETSQKVAAACLDAWVNASMTGKDLPNCQPILQQVQDLSVRKLNLEQ